MNFFTQKSFPPFLKCGRCKMPPQSPRFSMCECIYCLKCTNFKTDTFKCLGCARKVKSEFKNIPEFYMYLLENIRVKCQTCLKQEPALMFQKHFNQCLRKRQKEQASQQFDKYLCGNIQLLISKQNSNIILPENEILEFENLLLQCKLCKTEISGIQIIYHFSICAQQIISCDDQLCKWSGTRQDFIKHIKLCLENQAQYYDTQINLLQCAQFACGLELKQIQQDQHSIFLQQLKQEQLQPILESEDTLSLDQYRFEQNLFQQTLRGTLNVQQQ